jgi:hypothetical protein
VFARVQLDEAVQEEEKKKKQELDARQIDAFWLQRKISEYYKDPHTSQKISEDVFRALSDLEADDRAAENKVRLRTQTREF